MKKPKKRKYAWVQYTTIGITYTAYIGIAFYFGILADRYFNNKFPIIAFSATCIILVGSIYKLYKQLGD